MKKILFLLFVLPLVACGGSTEQVDQESTQQEIASISIENQKNESLLDEIVKPDSEKDKPIKKESVFLSDYKSSKYIAEKINLEKLHVTQTLDQPWGMDFIDSNTLIITEKKGNLILFDLNKKISKDIQHDIPVVQSGQGGLLDVVVFDQFLYLNLNEHPSIH